MGSRPRRSYWTLFCVCVCVSKPQVNASLPTKKNNKGLGNRRRARARADSKDKSKVKVLIFFLSFYLYRLSGGFRNIPSTARKKNELYCCWGARCLRFGTNRPRRQVVGTVQPFKILSSLLLYNNNTQYLLANEQKAIKNNTQLTSQSNNRSVATDVHFDYFSHTF